MRIKRTEIIPEIIIIITGGTFLDILIHIPKMENRLFYNHYQPTHTNNDCYKIRNDNLHSNEQPIYDSNNNNSMRNSNSFHDAKSKI
jgi:hypothetical protein